MNLIWNDQRPTPLDQASLNWFKTIRNQFLLLAPATDGSPEREKILRVKIETMIGKDERNLVLQDLFDLEDWVLALLPKEQLAQRYLSLRTEYQYAFGDEAWKVMLASLQPAVDANNETQNRVEARRLQEELHWQASIRPWATHKREQMMTVTLFVTAVVICFAAILSHLGRLDLSHVIIISGVLGGAISTIQRIQAAALASPRALMLARYQTINLGVVLSPLLGGVFALIMTQFLLARLILPGLFIPDVSIHCGTNGPDVAPVVSSNGVSSTVVTTPIVPRLTDMSTNLLGVTNIDLVTNGNNITPLTSVTNLTGITSSRASSVRTDCDYDFFSLELRFASGKDLVLLVLLAFAAGFSERLVPDLLTRLEDATKKSSTA